MVGSGVELAVVAAVSVVGEGFPSEFAAFESEFGRSTKIAPPTRSAAAAPMLTRSGSELFLVGGFGETGRGPVGAPPVGDTAGAALGGAAFGGAALGRPGFEPVIHSGRLACAGAPGIEGWLPPAAGICTAGAKGTVPPRDAGGGTDGSGAGAPPLGGGTSTAGIIIVPDVVAGTFGRGSTGTKLMPKALVFSS